MSIGYDDGVSVVVGIGIQANEAVHGAMNNQSTGVVLLVQLLTKDTASAALRLLYVGIAPRRPEIIHAEQCIWVESKNSLSKPWFGSKIPDGGEKISRAKKRSSSDDLRGDLGC